MENINNILSIKNFYNNYKDFDIIWYKKFNKDKFNKIYYEIIDIFQNSINENVVYSYNTFEKKYNIDLYFVKNFYNKFNDKSYIDIAIYLIENNNYKKYILSNESYNNIFNKKFIEDKLTNKNLISMSILHKILDSKKYINKNIEILYKSYLYNNYYIKYITNVLDLIVTYNLSYKIEYPKVTENIEELVYSTYSDFNLKLYKYLYFNSKNISDSEIFDIFYREFDKINNELESNDLNKKKKDYIIYSYNTFIENINDFNYKLFNKHFMSKKFNNVENIIKFYIENIENITYIYSEKIFYILYPNFNIEYYKFFNKNIINLYINHKNDNNLFNLNILNNYHKSNKDNIICSLQSFYEKYNDFNLILYKTINKNLLNYEKDEDYIFNWYKNKDQIYSISTFLKVYNMLNLNIYKCYLKYILKLEFSNDTDILINFYNNLQNNNKNIIYSIDSFYKIYNDFNYYIYINYNGNFCMHIDILDLSDVTEPLIISEENAIIYFLSHDFNNNIVYSINTFLQKNKDFSLKIYKYVNKDIDFKNLSDEDIIIDFIKKYKYQDRIYSVNSFNKFYPNIKFENNENIEIKIINYMDNGLINNNIENNNIGHVVVNNIYEVLIDLSHEKLIENLTPGISLIIRAKNEELNIKYCIESVVDLVDEIIFVDNYSTDNTYNIVKEYQKKYNNIKLYQYNINVSKVGITHQNALKNNNKNTLATFYNWCLSKATKYNVFKWDADFICIRNNFIQLVDLYNLKTRNDKFAIWFSGKTLFENNNKYYLNNKSFYDEYRIFSYKNDFKWYDGNTCEYVEPYLNNVLINKKYKYLYPLFYEIKRTSINEFEERSSLIDQRDINDYNILQCINNNDNNNNNNNNNNSINTIINNLIYVKKEFIEDYRTNKYKIIIYTPSLGIGGGNQYVINLYNILKIFGYTVIVIPLEKYNKNNKVKNYILDSDILDFSNFNIDYIKKNLPKFILFNSSIHFSNEDLIKINNLNIKTLFVTHSDVAYSNIFIKKYFNLFYKILTVNNYTIEKIVNKLNIKYESQTKLIKIINYSNILELDNKKIYPFDAMKVLSKKFGIISRFSEDKNIPMLLCALVEVFKKYNDYKFYLIGCHNENYDNYLKYLCKYLNIDKYVFFEGYQKDTLKYYKMFDFIILPSLSEGCSYNIIEAMNLGVPIICSDVGGNHELIQNNINGITINYTNIRLFEKTKLYIENYNEHLSEVGYIINNNLNDLQKQYLDLVLKNSFKCYLKYIDVLIPEIIYNKDYNTTKIFQNINDKLVLWNANKNNISNAIMEMIQLDNNKINNFINYNIKFIKDNFNENIYINQILNLFGIIHS